MKHEYSPRGVCARKIEFTINTDSEKKVDVLNDVKLVGGCPGNGAGVAALVEGMEVDEVIERLEGIRCGGRPSSCPAQLAQALKATR
jgi:uncharacterized protein (TIGR03905 family)